jgi:Mg-chelatase subunit ChlD
MTEANKKTALKRIRALKAQDCTNLWHGLRRALQILEDADSVPENTQAIYVLTDGKVILLHTCRKD